MNLWVVDTVDKAYLGTVEEVGDNLIVRTGLRGHPAVVPMEDIESVIWADGHPDVEQ
jgi:hypothetical protein